MVATRLEKLKELEKQLKTALDGAGSRDMAPIARQYREVLREIAELEGEDDGFDEIARIVARSRKDG